MHRKEAPNQYERLKVTTLSKSQPRGRRNNNSAAVIAYSHGCDWCVITDYKKKNKKQTKTIRAEFPKPLGLFNFSVSHTSPVGPVIPVMTRVERQADEAGRYQEAPHLLDIASFHSMRIWSDFLIVRSLMNLLPSLSHFDKLFPHKSKLHKHKDSPPTPPPQQNLEILLYIPSVRLLLFFFYTHIFYSWDITSRDKWLFFFFYLLCSRRMLFT